MKRIYIFGVGKGKEIVKENLIQDNVELLGYIDNNASAYTEGIDGIKVLLPGDIEEDYDYIVVSVMRYQYIDEQLFSMGIEKDKVIHFFSFDDSKKEEYWCILHKNTWRLEAMSYEFEKKVRPYSRNIIYEIADTRNKIEIRYPQILPAEKAVELICEERKSLARFGDGEFELMQMKKRAKFQSVSEKLANRLKEIVRSKNERVIIAIADTYGSLTQYTQAAAEDIRAYLSPEIRQEHMALLDLNKVYYDAFISRPYILYKDKKDAKKKFNALKQIWNDQDVLLVEGNQTRMGVGNDLFDNAKSIERVITPNVDAFLKYDEILSCVTQIAKNKLILIALGPTATVLAYDLAIDGFWALDIGHLDIEYEWYKAGLKETRDVPYKYVNEVNKGTIVADLPEKLKEKYEKEIVCSLA